MSSPNDHNEQPLHSRPSPSGENPAPVDAQSWAAYRDGTLDGPLRDAVEARLAWLEANLDLDPDVLDAAMTGTGPWPETAKGPVAGGSEPSLDDSGDLDAEAAEGLAALQADLGSTELGKLEAALRKEIGILSQEVDQAPEAGLLQKRTQTGSAPRSGGRIRRMRPARMAIAAVLLGAMIGGLFMVTKWLESPEAGMAMDRPSAVQQEIEQTRPDARPNPNGEVRSEALPLEEGDASRAKTLDVQTDESTPQASTEPTAPSALPPPALEYAKEEKADAPALDANLDAAFDAEPDEDILEDEAILDMAFEVLEEEAESSYALDLQEPPIPAVQGGATATQSLSNPTLPISGMNSGGLAPEDVAAKELEQTDHALFSAGPSRSANTVNPSGRLQGQVLDASGEPLIGVSVYLEGTSIGAATDLDGRFSLEAPPGQYEAQVRYVGYQNLNTTLTLEANATGTVEWQMADDAMALENVAITSSKGGRKRDRTQKASSLERSTDSESPVADGPGDPPSGTPASQSTEPSPASSSGAAPPMLQYGALLDRAVAERTNGQPSLALQTLQVFPQRTQAGDGAFASGETGPSIPEHEADGALLLRAQCHLDLQQPALAENALQPLLNKPDGSFFDAARFHMAEAHWALDRPEAARTLWQALAYGNGPWADQARERLDGLDD